MGDSRIHQIFSDLQCGTDVERLFLDGRFGPIRLQGSRELLVQLLHLKKELLGSAACFGQNNAMVGAGEQLHIQFFFQFSDCSADSWLGQKVFFCDL